MSDREHPMTTADLANAGEARQAEGQAHGELQTQEQTAQGQGNSEAPAPLLPTEEVSGLRTEWDRIQTGFVDEPRRAVESADALVAQAMKRLAEIFASERAQLEGQWDRGDNVSTEDLRLALQRYRAFFGRLLSV